MIKPYLVTMTHNKQRTQLKIIAANSVDAVIIGAALLRKMNAAGAISSKPIQGIAA
jgi:hypothetical protein